MIVVRKASERGKSRMDWLDSNHTFSFADYMDPEWMGFRALRVINDDTVAPARGFGAHPHRDMEIVSYVLDGALAHRDSMGTGSVIRPGDVQRMSAGTGVVHSEMNPSPDEPVHFLQIWIVPERARLTPSYEQKNFPDSERKGRLRLVASRDGREGSVTVHQDVSLYATVLGKGDRVEFRPAHDRHAWLHVAKGTIELNGTTLSAGDGAAISSEPSVVLSGDGEALLFDLA